MQNEAQYDLDRKVAKISSLSSNNLDKYEYLTGEDLGLKPNTIEQARFEYSPLGKIFNKGLSEDDKKEGIFKRLKYIENAQKGLINSNNKPDSARSKSSILSDFDIISSKSKDEDEDEDEDEKTARELYQDGRIEDMKGLKLPDEIEIKDKKSQMYLENNLSKIKMIFLTISTINIKSFLSILLKKKCMTTKYFQIKLIILLFAMYIRHVQLFNLFF